MNTPAKQVGKVATERRPPPPTGSNQDARHLPLSRADKLAQDAAEAAELRRHRTHPDVVALRVERVREQVDRLCWAGIVLGLSFTMVNVQSFAADGATRWSLPWLTAWLLDPMVSLVLLAILRAEQMTSRYRVHCGRWVRGAKWFTLTAAYVMNTWQSYAAGSLSGIVLHSVPPLIVFVAAEAVTDLRDKLTTAVSAAFTEAAQDDKAASSVNGDPSVHEQSGRGGSSRSRNDAKRKLSGTYLAEARQAWTPSVAITPAWVRQVTGCSRGLSSRLAATLATELESGEHPNAGSEVRS